MNILQFTCLFFSWCMFWLFAVWHYYKAIWIFLWHRHLNFFWLLYFLYIHFVYLCACATSLIFIAACRIFSYSKQTFSCGMWDLVPWPGIEPRAPALEALCLSLWTTREVPLLSTLASSYQESLMVYVYLPWRIISFLNVERNLWLVHWGFPWIKRKILYCP